MPNHGTLLMSTAKRIKYGLSIPYDQDDLEIELAFIANGGYFTAPNGARVGLGMFEHLMNARKLAWPNRYRHRWTDLMYRNFVENDVTVLLGAASTQKTSHACEYVLLNYFARPDNTLVVLSTVNMDKLDIGVWGEVKMLWKQAKELYPWIPGNLIDHKRALSTDNLLDDGVRDMRKGVIGRPCYVGGRWVGLGILAGLKQEYIFYVADELQFMQEAFSASWPHLFSNGNVKVIGSGNPKHDPDDELGKTAEPGDGWNSHPEPQKTEVWKTKFMGAKCINLVGTDSPNFDVPDGSPEPYPKLVGRKFAARIAHDHGPESFEYYRLVKGVMRVAFAHSRVITRQLCREHHALEKAVWKGTPLKRVYSLDPTYGGDDRCVGMCLEWGESVEGEILIRIVGYRVYKFDLSTDRDVELQIADILAEELNNYGVASEDCFYDSVGKGTLGGPFAIKFGNKPPVAVDSGDQPTKRPVRQDLFVEEENGTKRLKMCYEHYSKFVSEMWFSVRYCVEANQLRELPEEVMAEGCARIYEMVAGNKIQVEPKSDPKKKEDLKRRLGKSPDLFDTLAIGIEGARQRGFLIARLGDAVAGQDSGEDSFDADAEAWDKAIKDNLLVHS